MQFQVIDVIGSIQALRDLSLEEKVDAINKIRSALHEISPFSSEPVDLVEWVKADTVVANDYNPNSVAPPEMELLRVSIMSDGYTQPIVTFPWNGGRTVIDGFHRNRVGKECKDVRERVFGYLPVVKIRPTQEGKGERIASTIRHNRARGKHKVEAMSDIVIELKRRNWSDEKIGRELGMDPDEVLRLCQITGLAEAFKDQQFSEAWEADKEFGQAVEVISDEFKGDAEDGDRILHTWDKWECFKHGFYAERCPDGMTQEEGEEVYRQFLADIEAFDASLSEVTSQWKHSCEHYLTNDRMNRIAWLGQAAIAQARRIPSMCRGGYHRLTQDQKYEADQTALKHLNRWLEENGRHQLMLSDAVGRTEAELY